MAWMQRLSGGVLWRSAVWMVVSVLFLDVSVSRVQDLRASGQFVSVWRYMQVAFWVVLFVFWLVAGIRDWRAWRATRKVS